MLLKTIKKITKGPAVTTRNNERSWKKICELIFLTRRDTELSLFSFCMLNSSLNFESYLKLTEACHTKAKRKNKIGITGKTSTNGL